MDVFETIKNIELEFENSFHVIIEEYLKDKNIKQNTFCHNHPPLFGIISGCEYCKLYGNILENGPVSIENTDILQYLYKDN